MSSDFDSAGQHAVEVIPGLILGGIIRLDEIPSLKPDVLVPLDWLPGWVWNSGFRGEIVYCPITDYGILPDDVLDRYAEKIAGLLREGKRVGMFCIGGHGRTGYMASCVLSALGEKQPVRFLREHYSYKAVETLEQEKAVGKFAGRHEVSVDFSTHN